MKGYVMVNKVGFTSETKTMKYHPFGRYILSILRE
jgi:hypothetical protein